MITSPLTKSIVSPIVSRITAISASTTAAANVELIINGTFDTNSDSWPTYGSQPPESITVESGQLNLAGVQHSAVAQIIPTEIGESYPIAAYVEQDGYVQVKSIDGTTIIDNLNNGADGTFSDTFVALETQTIIILALGATGLGVFDNISVKQTKLVINGGFDVNTDYWDSTFVNISVDAGRMKIDGNGVNANGYASQDVNNLVAGNTYNITLDFEKVTADFRVRIDSTDILPMTQTDSYSVNFVADSPTVTLKFVASNNANCLCYLDNISVVKV
ncbi:MAG: hypothetical protein GY829_00010 [Gammaproteobacteria bacterium]|nr:hypothetical protein [Gammaproteobacteria bacterium]